MLSNAEAKQELSQAELSQADPYPGQDWKSGGNSNREIRLEWDSTKNRIQIKKRQLFL